MGEVIQMFDDSEHEAEIDSMQLALDIVCPQQDATENTPRTQTVSKLPEQKQKDIDVTYVGAADLVRRVVKTVAEGAAKHANKLYSRPFFTNKYTAEAGETRVYAKGKYVGAATMRIPTFTLYKTEDRYASPARTATTAVALAIAALSAVAAVQGEPTPIHEAKHRIETLFD